MFQEITYALIFGIPAIVYLGIVTLILFILTAAIASLKRKGKLKNVPIKWHFRFAGLSLILAVVHGVLGLLAYL